jgi:methyl-accepting chemotaxis protein
MMPANNVNDTPDYSAQLATVERQVEALADTGQVVEQMAGALDYLYETGADATALQAVSDNASQLLETNQQLDQALKSVAEIARTIQQQRDATRQALSELKAAIEQADTGVPEISDLYESLSEMAQEDAETYLMEVLWEIVVDNITSTTSLSYSEAVELTDLLTGGLIEEDHPVWQELREWISRSVMLLEDGSHQPETAY